MAFRLADRRRLAGWLRGFAPLRWALKVAVRVFAPRHYVGAVVAIFDDGGRVLLVEHVFRTDFPWGLPGGWISRGEAPRDTVSREVREELNLEIDVREILLASRIPPTRMANHPSHLGVAYYARLKGGDATTSGEVLSMRWVEPRQIDVDLEPFQKSAVAAGAAAFERERMSR